MALKCQYACNVNAPKRIERGSDFESEILYNESVLADAESSGNKAFWVASFVRHSKQMPNGRSSFALESLVSTTIRTTNSLAPLLEFIPPDYRLYHRGFSKLSSIIRMWQDFSRIRHAQPKVYPILAGFAGMTGFIVPIGMVGKSLFENWNPAAQS